VSRWRRELEEALALVFGVFGIFLALAPRTRGGGLSIIAIILSLIGGVAPIIKAIIWILQTTYY
jgi:hypothetical protein